MELESIKIPIRIGMNGIRIGTRFLEVPESELEFEYPRTLVSELESVPKFSDSPALLMKKLIIFIKGTFPNMANKSINRARK